MFPITAVKISEDSNERNRILNLKSAIENNALIPEPRQCWDTESSNRSNSAGR